MPFRIFALPINFMGHPAHLSRLSSQRAFSLVEMSVVVTLIGLMAAIAIPSYRHLTLRSKATAVVNDIRSFSTACITYSAQNGHWPTSTGTPGQIPPEVLDAISSGFSRPTPIGGYYNWETNNSSHGFHVTAALSIISTGSSVMSDDVEMLQMINDDMESDHDLHAGSVQVDGTNNLVFVVEP
jgi:prepilin-type N-terminal cleavage/methylation domain-containing protein